MPVMYIIAGPNGAGKTTASNTLLPGFLGVDQFVNADEIAKGLSPFAPESVAIESARIMLSRITALIAQKLILPLKLPLPRLPIKAIFKRQKKGAIQLNLFFFGLIVLKSQKNG